MATGPLPPSPGTLQVVAKGNDSLNKWHFANVFHCSKVSSSTWSASDVTALLSVLTASTGTANPFIAIATAMDTNVSYTSMSAVELVPSGLVQTASCNVQGALGGAGNIGIPPNGCAVASWSIARRVRGGHPRTYFPGVVQAQMNGQPSNTFTTAGRAQWLLAMQNFLVKWNAITVSSDSVELLAISYYDKLTNPTPPHLRPVPAVFPILSVQMHGRLDSQRRRLGKELP